MKITRRQFMKSAAVAGVGLALPWKVAVREAWAQYGFNSPNLTKFVDPIRPVGVIPIAAADAAVAPVTGVTHYTIDIRQFNDLLHSDFITQTRAFKNWRTPPVPAYIPHFSGTKLWRFHRAGN